MFLCGTGPLRSVLGLILIWYIELYLIYFLHLIQDFTGRKGELATALNLISGIRTELLLCVQVGV